MGYSPGEFTSDYGEYAQEELHWEGKGSGYIVLWTSDERTTILKLDKDNARKALDQLNLLVQMLEEDRP